VSHFLDNLQDDDIVLDALPDDVLASMESRDRWMAELPYAEGGLEFLVADVEAWTPGQTVRIAFLGGSEDLYKEIEDATAEIAESSNLTLDFGADGTYRTWSESDNEYAAEIRVSFDQAGYFSLVGNDSVNPNIGLPQSAVGGRPHQRSLNLGGFDRQRPPTWAGTTRHEFLHALGFHHEHQNVRGPCQAAFRWDDDPGYQPTTDANGRYVPDANGLRPGVYTYLSGYPNGWARAKVDHNLRAGADSQSLTAGVFDAGSVMLYRFPPLFYRTNPSPCAPMGDGQHLSDGDKAGLAVLYPQHRSEIDGIAARRESLLGVVESAAAGGGLESMPGSGAPDIAAQTEATLRSSVEQLRA
jgi:hypothetical protein